MKKLFLVALVAGAAQFAHLPSAMADDGKTLSNNACHGTLKGDRDRSLYHTTMLRAVGGEVQLNCGLVRDSIGNSGAKLKWVDVRYDKNTNNKSISGRVYSCNAAFHECHWRAGNSSSNSGQHSVFINTPTLPFNNTFGRYLSYWSRLPEGDELMSIDDLED